MALWLKYVLIGIGGYLMGNISLGIIIARFYGIKDIRNVGSGNAGTTNVLRNLGWLPSIMTLVGDCVKSLIPALIGGWIAGDIGLLIGGTAAIIGHDFPVFFKFRGGKGIASTLGLIIAVDPLLALCMLLPVLVIIAITRYVSVGSIYAAFSYPVLTWLFTRREANAKYFLYFSLFASLLTLFCHRANIKRLIRREENRLDFKKISKLSQKFSKKNKEKE